MTGQSIPLLRSWISLPLVLCAALSVTGGRAFASMQENTPPDAPFDGGMALGDSLAAERIDAPVERPTTWHSMVTNVPGDIAGGSETVVSGPGLEVAGGVGLLTGLLMVTDRFTNHATQDIINRNPWMQSTCSVFQYIGNGRTHLGIAAAFAAAGLIADDSRALRTASQTVEGLLATGIVVQALKHMTGRESPAAASQAGGVWRFFPSFRSYIRNQPKYYSFPSGHIATTMTTVTIIAENYPEQEWIRPVGYGIVGLVGVSLVGVKYHWYSDLPVGIGLGYLFGKVIAHKDRPGDEAIGTLKSPALSVSPSIGPFGAGITLGLTL